MAKPTGMISEKNEEALDLAIEAIKKSWDIANQEFQKNSDDPRFYALLRSFDAAAYAIEHGRKLLRREPFANQTMEQVVAAMKAAEEWTLRYKG